MPTVKEIVAIWLKENGYDGLFYPGVCACKLGDLIPCGEISAVCEAGYVTPCDPNDEEGPDDCNGRCEFHIGATKP